MWLNDVRAVLPDTVLDRASVLIDEGRIADIVEGPVPGRPHGRMIDGRGLTIIPGIIDIHGDMLEREIEPRPGAHFPIDMALLEHDKRLAGCGITTAYAALSFYETDQADSVRSRAVVREVIGTLHQLRRSLLVDHYVHARFEVSTPTIADIVGELLTSGQLHLLSLMDHTPGQGQYRDIERYVTFIARWRQIDRSHVERELQERMARAHDQASMWELARDLIGLAQAQGLPIASHDDDTIEKVDLVASLGTTICEFPVTLEAAQEARRRGMHVVMGAPNVLRGGSHSGNLSAIEAISAGQVDALAADYYPAALLHAAFEIEAADILPLAHAVRLITAGPAAALGLQDRGRIAPGLLADLVLIEPGGRPRVRGTLRHGAPVFWDREMHARTFWR